MLSKRTIGFLGAGNMAEALIKGLIAGSSASAARILASDTSSERLVHLAEAYDIKVYNNNHEVADRSDILILAVKPADVDAVLTEAGPELGSGKLLVSIAAGITTDALSRMLDAAGTKNVVPIVRAMPNTPAMVGEAAVAIYPGPAAGEDSVGLATELFASVGKVVILEDESLMDAVTGLSGSGPAYVYLFMEALVDAGEKAGLKREDAKTLAMQTTLGAARLAQQSRSTLAELRRMVSSPGGTTAEGVKKLEEADFRNTVAGAVKAATQRAHELSGKDEK